MHSEIIYPDRGLTNHQRDRMLAPLLERDGLLFEEFYLREVNKR